MRTLIIAALVVVGAVILLGQSLFVVDETEQVITLRFGEVRKVNKTPGLYTKMPFTENIAIYDKRILRIDAPPVAMPDKDKQNLVIDSYARYRIVDPVQFRQTLRTEGDARSRLGDIITSILRDQIALRERSEIIGAKPVLDPAGNSVIDEEGLPQIVGTDTRSAILDEVLQRVKKRVAEQNYGVEIIDVRLKRADFPSSVTPSIYTRMRSERNRIATSFRADGDKQDLQIRSEANKRRDIILAEADRTSSEVRGAGEAKAINVLAQAHNRDPELFAFLRSLEAYRTIIGEHDTLVLSTESQLFEFLQGSGTP
ncbi:MAG: protease modulator HflC [Dehalococcoidia bacterium]|nr:protease modulator HflC [Dehalococcoidia bacterium]MSQ17138.1 protease modulator HflC [Dehalococcoidia bacterium]